MDMAIVNSINTSGQFPPHDPWFAGSHLNYYYFGHYIVAFLVRTVGIAPEVGYNLGGRPLLRADSERCLRRRLRPVPRPSTSADAPPRTAVLPGLAAVAFAMAGNLAGAVRYLHHPGWLAEYNWFAPSRVIPHTANEFPYFSFLLGDLHAHVLAVPFALTALGLHDAALPERAASRLA